MKYFKSMILIGGALAALCSASACTMTSGNETQPLPSLTEQFSQPLYVNVAYINVETQYDPLANANDVSSTFPTPPDIALKRYAETRLKAAGGTGTLRFIIQDASVYREYKESDVEMARWLRIDDKEKYTAVIRIGLYRETDGYTPPGAAGAELRAERTMTIPEGWSLDQRDRRIQEYMAQLLSDVDAAVQENINTTLRLSAPEPAPSPGPFPVGPVDIVPTY